jgi:hypothetical protein
VGPDQEGFFRFYAREIFPQIHESRPPARAMAHRD